MSRDAESRAGIHACLMLAALLLVSSCAEKELPDTLGSPAIPSTPIAEKQSPSPPPPAPVQAVYRETGIASWYGRDFHGRKTASGEAFDMYGLSAAHRTLPLGAVVRVTNLDNFKSLQLKVNDRGPFAGNRVLEVSYAAARELGFAQQGTARVKIETFEAVPGKSMFTVVAAIYSEEENALLLKDRLSRKFEVIVIVPFDSNAGKFYRVRVGSYHSEEKAELIAGKLKLEGLEPFVMRKD